MQETHCPLCFAALETREVAPFDECGCNPVELNHLREGKHIYTEYQVFPGLNLTLCDFCAVDFGSHDPAFFGLAKATRIGFEKMNFVRQLEHPLPRFYQFCPHCGYALPFLRFVKKARERHALKQPSRLSTRLTGFKQHQSPNEDLDQALRAA